MGFPHTVLGTALRSNERTTNQEVNAMDRRSFLKCAASVGFGAATLHSASAQSFPSNTIRIVVPNSASTPPEILARIVANALQNDEGWKVIVENKPGGVMTMVLRRCSSTLPTVTQSFPLPRRSRRRRLSFRTRRSIIEKDFTPLIRIGTGYNVLAVNPSVPVHSVKELVEYLKKIQASIPSHLVVSVHRRI